MQVQVYVIIQITDFKSILIVKQKETANKRD